MDRQSFLYSHQCVPHALVLAFLMLASGNWVLRAQVPQAQESGTAAQASGQIQGKAVSDSDGSPFANSSVTAYRISPAPTVRAKATTAADGSFTITGLASGKYGICVTDGTANFINPCQWADLQTTVNITDGQVSRPTPIRVKKAFVLNVRVNDMAQVLLKKPSDAAAPHVLVGVSDLKGNFHAAIAKQRDRGGISYELRIPFDFPVRFTVYSASVKLTDSQQLAVPLQGRHEFIVQPSAQTQPRTIVFNAVGRNP